MRMMKWCCSNTVARRLPILLSTAHNTRRIPKSTTWARHQDSLTSHRTYMTSNHQKPLIHLVLNRIKTILTSTRMQAPFRAGDTSPENLSLHIKKELECLSTILIKDIKVSQRAILNCLMRQMIRAILQQT